MGTHEHGTSSMAEGIHRGYNSQSLTYAPETRINGGSYARLSYVEPKPLHFYTLILIF